MNLLNGEGRGSHITGLSVHNQRIERLWRDVFTHVIHYYYNLFYSYEDEGLLEPDNEIQKCSLQTVYLPEIRERLSTFRNAWNNHSMHSKNDHTPNQVWLAGMIGNQQVDSTAIKMSLVKTHTESTAWKHFWHNMVCGSEQLEAEEIFDHAVEVKWPQL